MKKSIFKRVTSFVLASAVAASAMVTAFATTINIMPGTYSKTPSSENDADATRYVAYQIFTGTIGNGIEGGFSDVHEHKPGDDVYAAVDLAKYAEDAEEFAEKVIAAIEAGTVDGAADETATELRNLFADYKSTTAGADPDKGYDAWKADYDDVEAAVKFLEELYWENRHTMQNIKWGEDVTDVAGLLGVLADADWGNANISNAFDAINNSYTDDQDNDAAAMRVAKVLAGTFNSSDLPAELNITPSFKVEKGDINTEFLQKFAKVVYGAIESENNTKKSKWVAGTGDDKGHWEIDLGTDDSTGEAKTGYYLIADTKPATEFDEVDIRAPYFVDVFTGDTVEIDLKSDAPTIDKTIEAVDGTDDTVAENDKSATAEIGDTISYKLVGTLPENFGDYFNAFYYRFTDTLDKSLILDESSIKITIVGLDGTGGKTVVYEEEDVTDAFDGKLTDTNFGVKPATDDETGKTTLKITFTDLLGVLKAYVDNTAKFAAIDWTKVKVEIEYDAVLSADAEVGIAGNKNAANLTYTNDPNSDYDPDDIDNPDDEDPPEEDITTTTDRVTDVYTYGITLDKEDINSTKLAGAGFTVTDKETGETAVFVAGGKSGEYIFIGWANIPEDGELDAGAFKADGEIAKRLEAVLGAEWNTKTLLTEITTAAGSAEEGKEGEADDSTLAAGALSIKGLNTDVTYNFSETNAPENYKAVEDFEVTLVSEVEWTESTRETEEAEWDDPSEETGSLAMYAEAKENENASELLKVSDDYKYTGKLYGDQEAEEDIGTQVSSPDSKTAITSTESNGYVTLRVEDPHQTNNMPGTGGSGVYFYYIVGGALVLLAGAALFFTRKKSDKKS